MPPLNMIWVRLAIIYLPPLALLCAAILAAMQMSIPTTMLTRDPTSIGKIPLYSGALSVIGVMMWCAAASACAIAFLTLRSFPPHRHSSRFFLCAACFSALLMIDDAFRLHESFGPFQLGIPSPGFYAAYAAMLLLGLFIFRDLMINRSLPVLMVAMFFFAIAGSLDVIADQFHLYFYKGRIAEDALEFLGIAGYLGYLADLSIQHLSRLSPENRVQPPAAHLHASRM